MIARGRQDYTKRTLDSLKATVPLGTTISCWHNGDPSDQMFEWMTTETEITFIVSPDDIGWGAGHNQHIDYYDKDLEEYSHVLFTDNDVEYKEGWFDTCDTLLHKYPKIGVLAVWKHEAHGLFGEQYPDMVCKDQMPGCGWLFMTNRLRELLPFREKGTYEHKGGIGEDVQFCITAAEKGYLIAAPLEDVAIHIDGY